MHSQRQIDGHGGGIDDDPRGSGGWGGRGDRARVLDVVEVAVVAQGDQGVSHGRVACSGCLGVGIEGADDQVEQHRTHLDGTLAGPSVQLKDLGAITESAGCLLDQLQLEIKLKPRLGDLGWIRHSEHGGCPPDGESIKHRGRGGSSTRRRHDPPLDACGWPP